MSDDDQGFGCPFCGVRVTDQVVVVPALRLFELHLDKHMELGDQLLSRHAS